MLMGIWIGYSDKHGDGESNIKNDKYSRLSL